MRKEKLSKMKYYKTSKFTKAVTSTGFITMIACLLIAVGAIGWFALSRKDAVSEAPSNNSSVQSYPKTDSSYNSKVEVPIEEPQEPVNDSVSDVPYNEEVEETQQKAEENATFILPITGNISKGFSDTALQHSATYGDMRLHTGVDILCEKGADIKSVGSGSVKSVSDDAKLGRVITIEYDEKITVKYCGMGSVNVKESDKVATGDVIGTLGEIPSECADNSHIHIEVFVDGECASPLAALGLE